MNRNIFIPTFLSIFLMLFASCETLRIDEQIEKEPVILSFTPKAAPIGATVLVEGQYLNDVIKAEIGGVEVEIKEKVSNTKMYIKVVQGVKSGKLALTNNVGKGESEDVFTCSFAVPQVYGNLLQESVLMGENILIPGKNLNSVIEVLFTADGYSEPHKASLINQEDDELVVKVPYVEKSKSFITLVYFDGSENVSTELSSAPNIEVIRNEPSFDAYTFTKTAVGRSLVLTGTYLNNIEKVLVGEHEAVFFAEPRKLTFTIPAGDFKDGETVVAIKIVYFDGNEQEVLADNFVVFVPYVKYWEGMQIVCQGRTEASSFASFFSPENGKIYENAKWKTDLDPIAIKYANSQWGSSNTPKAGVVKDEDYNSVLPYFFFSAVSGNVIQLNSPANSNSQLKNFYINAVNPEGTASNDNRVPGGNTTMPGTPILAFRYLNPASSDANETALIDKVLKGEIENINEDLFPIDIDAKTIAGISVSSMSGGIKSSSWCDHQTASLTNNLGYEANAVFMVAYYHNNSFVKDNPTTGIKRLGFLHVKTIDWMVYNASTPNYGSTTVTFNCYWQKYDYNYEKL